MKKTIKILFVAVLGVCFVSGIAMADAINVRPYDDFGSSGEPTLNTILNKILNTEIDAVDDQSASALWNAVDGGGHSYSVAAFAGWDGTFGIYSSTGETKTLFDLKGSSSDGKVSPQNLQKTFSISDDGKIEIDGDVSDTTGWETFGFYYYRNNSYNYTEDSKNNGNARALAYALEAGTSVDLDYYGAWNYQKTFTSDGDDWLMAFEGGSDKDFNDAIFLVEDIKPVPEPGTMVLLGFGLIGLAAFGRKKGILQK